VLEAVEERATAANRLARRTRASLLVMLVLFLMSVLLAWRSIESAREARAQQASAERQRTVAQDLANEVKRQREIIEQFTR
jgi:predicted negative regulator of RcsB-dependent stress response